MRQVYSHLPHKLIRELIMLKIALAQIESRSDTLQKNLEKHFEMISKATEEEADLVIFPELSLHGHCSGAQATEVGLTKQDKIINDLAHHSVNITCIVGGIESTKKGLYYNTSYVLRDGKVQAKHRKLNIPSYGNLDEGKYYCAGKSHTVFDLPEQGLKVGLLTCADSWNPALVYTLALTGCQIILQPISAALNAVKGDYNNQNGWQINLSHTAMTWGTFVVMVNRVGNDEDYEFFGGSSVIDPYGNSLKKMDDKEQLDVVTIDPKEIHKARFNLPTLRDAQVGLISQLLHHFKN